MKVTVNNQDKEEVIDWNKVQLVQSSLSGLIYITLGIETFEQFDEFSAIQVKSGTLNKGLVKSYFKPFHGSITLQND